MSKHILLGISGGIAAYKSCELVRLLKKQGHDVTVAMSRAAAEFVSPLTFQALSGNPVLFETHGGYSGNGMAHINLTRQADVFLIAPATANTIAKIANGIADNLLTNLAAARKCPLVVAPTMNVEMWFNPANRRNIAQLISDGITVFQPAYGEQACGETGVGRMPEAVELAELLPDLWTEKNLQGKKVLITAGATFEAIDPVRGITNISSGQMGTALARACRAAGAEVTLIYGQLQTLLPFGLAHTEQAVSAQAMYEAVHKHIGRQDVFISVAAVADYKVKNSSPQKLKKDGSGIPPVIELAENPDILASVASLANPPFCIGFAAESENVLEHARAKRLRKNIPMLVANDVSTAMGKATNQITIIDEKQEISLPETDKNQAAAAIVTHLAEWVK
ncbi:MULTISPECIES: bifunctional phosphopantothenoylcysteine decarboxylase/phosphopantothenate--cysteine ligase CoaBC [unclassified Neisseria]|uniref:bifunctional phosphopantothenoylcysteine decarboxylase/phosphopantothenate--cysteine ligase CoaBC n=1 Tax=unclassified Neisseria TaxID=2623750 RepID=UPI002666E98E|nr:MULTISPECIES: bifunctional phosphopantothenoylcysteine decarboxylase/phosphopantothenate--cysteine ligase CoaBC [unclassified Neisseria]MDO1508823.1 bifunctional phosphopantothenoylcysteine decarboxylase/phosphopantothenate--cysteine ligase CoaBC [Neisseria sp. MVDL19-042950]MDO1515082.1 bifunctional phosphopantothenoylcysteine decarboxylase/phosphopantothenate--cysteine ligase CoaBC [Neisseria sp. MVDL18-041461]MDO1562442.1 bifunctional phosphopantothenoylcysteine decarboxylase/phosphopantot